MLKFIVVFVLLVTSAQAESFRSSKYKLTKLYTTQLAAVGFYSNCTLHVKGKSKKLVPDKKSCGYVPRRDNARSRRVEWEHVVPAHTMGIGLNCWVMGGRKQCNRTSGLFIRMSADMHNLVPSIGELNGDRSNYAFGNISGEARNYGRVDFEVDAKRRIAEPQPRVKGNIARIYFYMEDRYGLTIDSDMKHMLKIWNKEDPVDNEERMRNRAIHSVQGNYNKYITAPVLDWGCLSH